LCKPPRWSKVEKGNGDNQNGKRKDTW